MRGIPYLTRKSKLHIAIVIALGVILVALMLFAKLWSQSFYDFARLDRFTTFCISTPWEPITADTPTVEIEKENFSAFVDLMEDTSVHFRGISRQIHGKAGDKLYQIVLCHYENNEVIDESTVVLCNDGALYVHLGGQLGYIGYRLENCDIDAVAAVLDDLLEIG